MGKNYEDDILEWDNIYNGFRVPPVPAVTNKNSFALSSSTIEGYLEGEARNSMISQEVPRDSEIDRNYDSYANFTDLYATYISKDVRQTSLANMTARDYHAYPTYTIEDIQAIYTGESITSGVVVARFLLTTKMSYDIIAEVSISSTSGVIGTFSGSLQYEGKEPFTGKAVYLSTPVNVDFLENSTLTVVASLKYMDHPYHGINTKTIIITPVVTEDSYLYLSQVNFPNTLDLAGNTYGMMEVYEEDGSLASNVSTSSMIVGSNNTDSSKNPLITTGPGNPFTVSTDIGYNTNNESRVWGVLTTVNASGEYESNIEMTQDTYSLYHRGYLKSAGNRYESILIDGFHKIFNNRYIWVEVKSGGTVITPLTMVVISTAYTPSPGIVIPIKNIPASGEYDYEFIVTIEDPFDENGDYVIKDYSYVTEFLNPRTIEGKRPKYNVNQDYEFSGDIIGKSNTAVTLPGKPYNAYDLTLALEPKYGQQAISVYIRTITGDVWEYENTVTNEDGVWAQLINDEFKCQDIQVYIHRFNDINSLLYSGTINIGGQELGGKFPPDRCILSVNWTDDNNYTEKATFTIYPFPDPAALPKAYDISLVSYNNDSGQSFQSSVERIYADSEGKGVYITDIHCGYTFSILYSPVNDKGSGGWTKKYTNLYGVSMSCSTQMDGSLFTLIDQVQFNYSDKIGEQYLRLPVPSGPRLKCGDGSEKQYEPTLPGKVIGISSYKVSNNYSNRYGVDAGSGEEIVVIDWSPSTYANYYKVKYTYDGNDYDKESVFSEIGFVVPGGTSVGKSITVTIESFSINSDNGSISDVYTCTITNKLTEITGLTSSVSVVGSTRTLYFNWNNMTGAESYQVAIGPIGGDAYFYSSSTNSYSIEIPLSIDIYRGFKVRYGIDGAGCSVWTETYLVKVQGANVILEPNNTFLNGSIKCQNTSSVCSIVKSPIKLLLTTPTNVLATRTSSSTVNITWNNVSSADYYYLYYSTGASYIYGGSTSNLSISLTGITGDYISTKLTAKSNNPLFLDSDVRNDDFYVPPIKLETPENPRGSGTTLEYTINWDTVPHATSYTVNYGASVDDNTIYVTNPGGGVLLSYQGAQLKFKVRSASNAGIEHSDWTNVISVTGSIPDVTKLTRSQVGATINDDDEITYHWEYPTGSSSVNITITEYSGGETQVHNGLTGNSYVSDFRYSYNTYMKVNALSNAGAADSGYSELFDLYLPQKPLIYKAERKVTGCTSYCTIKITQDSVIKPYIMEWEIWHSSTGGPRIDSGTYYETSFGKAEIFMNYEFFPSSKVRIRGNYGVGILGEWSDYEDII